MIHYLRDYYEFLTSRLDNPIAAPLVVTVAGDNANFIWQKRIYLKEEFSRPVACVTELLHHLDMSFTLVFHNSLYDS